MSPLNRPTTALKKPLKTVELLTHSELDQSVSHLITFYHYTTFEERDVDATTAMLYALEFMACSLGLVRLDLPGPDGDTLMTDLVHALHNRAIVTKNENWHQVVASLPYSRGLSR